MICVANNQYWTSLGQKMVLIVIVKLKFSPSVPLGLIV